MVPSHRSDNICLTRWLRKRVRAQNKTQIVAGRTTNSLTDVKPTDPAHFLCRDPPAASWRAHRCVRICIIEIRARLCAKSTRSEAKPDHKTRRRRSNKQTKNSKILLLRRQPLKNCVFCKTVARLSFTPNSAGYRNISLESDTRQTE